MEKILKIDFQNFYILKKSQKVYFREFTQWKTIVKYAFHEVVWKKYFTVYPRLKVDKFFWELLIWEKGRDKNVGVGDKTEKKTTFISL